jgi:bis(5'-nucleosyl)-tetraphosphatase (symmetrical)
MATYVIGDIQGCLDDLKRLTDSLRFDPSQDKLWFTGDIVNRGPDSLGSLQFVRELGGAAITVLGNHDLHTLAVAHGTFRAHKSDTIEDILSSPDRDAVLDWLRQQPLLHHDSDLNVTLVHAGLPPQWDLEVARNCAHEVENMLRSDNYIDFLKVMYGNEPDTWVSSLEGMDRLRFITNCFTRLRFCNNDGKLDLTYKHAPGGQPEGYKPWFEIVGRRNTDTRVVFGHWSTLGRVHTNNITSLDTGCLWGGKLTAWCIEEDRFIEVDCPGYKKPKH